MEFIAVIYFVYMFISFYLLTMTLLLYFRNRDKIFEIPKITKFYSISVLIPAHNEEKTIEDSVKSIYNVDYPNIKEVIVINDGSTDNTMQIVKKLLPKYKNLRLINKENTGKADSLNRVIKLCKGDLIVVLDADSYPAKDSFRKMIGFFDDSEVGAVTCACTPRNRNNFIEKLQAIEYKGIAFTRKLLEFIDAIYVVPGTAAMYRREAIQKSGFDPKNITEDIEATWHLIKNGWKIRMCLAASVTTEVPSRIKEWYGQRRRWSVGGIQCINKYKDTIIKRGKLGFFILPFFAVGLFLGLIGVALFVYIMGSRLVSSYLIAHYSIETNVPIITMNELYITPSVLNYFGIILFALFLIFNMFVLAVMKDRLFEKQSFFNLLFYMTIYLLVYPLVLVESSWHFLTGRKKW